jgi:hypothetical protein
MILIFEAPNASGVTLLDLPEVPRVVYRQHDDRLVQGAGCKALGAMDLNAIGDLISMNIDCL